MNYLGPTTGRVILSTWDDIVDAATGGLLVETQWCELKKQLPPSRRDTNLELARDIAALSVHGGVLFVGITDDFEVVGCETGGIPDRITHVAGTIIHPPLTPIIELISNPADPSKHVVMITVPPSPLAPHMVDGKYWGRSSNGKEALSDARVRELITTRNKSKESFESRLLAMVNDDPLARFIQGHPTGNGHIYLLAEPCAPITDRPDVNLLDLARKVVVDSDQYGTFPRLVHQERDPLGSAVSSIQGDPIERRGEHLASYLLCHDADGSLAFVSGAGSMYRPEAEDSAREAIGVRSIIVATLEFYGLIQEISLNHWGYQGQWRVGIHITNLLNKKSSFYHRRLHPSFTRDTVTNLAVMSPAGWSDGDLREGVKEILKGFLRGIGRANTSLDEVLQEFS